MGIKEIIENKCRENNLMFLRYNNDLNRYENNRTKLILKCNVCGYIWDTTSYDKFILRTSRCQKCSGNLRKTKEEMTERIRERCDELGLVFCGYVEDRTDKTVHLKLKCPICAEEWETTTYNNLMKRDRTSHKCGRKNPSLMPVSNIYEERCHERIKSTCKENNFEFVRWKDERYGGIHNGHVILRCLECGELIDYKIDTVLSKGKIICKRCGYNGKVGNDEAVRTVEDKCRLLGYTFLGFDNDGNRYDGKDTRLILRCDACGYIWRTTSYFNFVHGVIKCRGCNNSWKMEKEVAYILKKNGIKYEEQKRFEWLKNKISLSLDFYLPDYNIFIECQGKQHFLPVEHFGGECGLYETRTRDKAKYQQCAEHGIGAVYYSKVKGFDRFMGEEIVRNEEELIKRIKNG